MKRLLLTSSLLILLVYLGPLLVQTYHKEADSTISEHTVQMVKAADSTQESQAENAKTEQSAQTEDKTRTITVSVDGQVQTMNLEDYVAGVVAAEIPASFPEEALKAQAVAARTFAIYKENLGKDEQHPDAVVCDDYTHCAAYVDMNANAEALWGSKASRWKKQIQAAVSATRNEILTYDGDAIAAVFHAASAGETESALDVWNADVPYLVSVSTSGDEACPAFTGSVSFSAEEFRQIMLRKYPKINLTGLPSSWFTKWKRNEAGYVETCTIGGVKVKGTDLRALLHLNSTNFSITTTDHSITFHTVGSGHGVGLSQYGAKNMADSGSKYADILLHYYSGAKVTKLDGEK